MSLPVIHFTLNDLESTLLQHHTDRLNRQCQGTTGFELYFVALDQAKPERGGEALYQLDTCARYFMTSQNIPFNTLNAVLFRKLWPRVLATVYSML